MWTKTFWLKTLEWTLKAGCAAAVAFLTANGTGILDIDFKQAASVVGLSTLVAFLTCIAGNSVGNQGTPSIVKSEPEVESAPTPPGFNYDTTKLGEYLDYDFSEPVADTPDTDIVKGDN